MSELSIDALRAAFNTPSRQSAPSNYFPFFAMADGETSEVRFLPDANKQNPLGFLVEKRTHTLAVNGRNKTVPCLAMYGKQCPVCQTAKAYYDSGDRVNGKKYYRKLQHIAQALVVNTTVQPRESEDSFPGTVRLLQISPQIYKVIHEAIMSGDLEDRPYDYENGTNFVIRKDKQGDYSTYNFSKFKKRETALDESTIDYVETQLKDLSTLLPAEPSLEEVEAWLEADLAGGQAPVATRSVSSTAAAVNAVASKASGAPTPVVQESDDDDDDGDADASDMDAVLAAIAARRNSTAV